MEDAGSPGSLNDLMNSDETTDAYVELFKTNRPDLYTLYVPFMHCK